MCCTGLNLSGVYTQAERFLRQLVAGQRWCRWAFLGHRLSTGMHDVHNTRSTMPNPGQHLLMYMMWRGCVDFSRTRSPEAHDRGCAFPHVCSSAPSSSSVGLAAVSDGTE